MTIDYYCCVAREILSQQGGYSRVTAGYKMHFIGIYGFPNARGPKTHFQKCDLGIEST